MAEREKPKQLSYFDESVTQDDVFSMNINMGRINAASEKNPDKDIYGSNKEQRGPKNTELPQSNIPQDKENNPWLDIGYH